MTEPARTKTKPPADAVEYRCEECELSFWTASDAPQILDGFEDMDARRIDRMGDVKAAAAAAADAAAKASAAEPYAGGEGGEGGEADAAPTQAVPTPPGAPRYYQLMCPWCGGFCVPDRIAARLAARRHPDDDPHLKVPPSEPAVGVIRFDDLGVVPAADDDDYDD